MINVGSISVKENVAYVFMLHFSVVIQPAKSMLLLNDTVLIRLRYKQTRCSVSAVHVQCIMNFWLYRFS